MLDTSRIEALRRRVEQDPASIAFAQLADELRREGHYADAVAVCRAGLLQHPSYISARVTLGRALVELGELDAAQVELEEVLHLAPENLAVVRALADLHERRRNAAGDPGDVPRAAAAGAVPMRAPAPPRVTTPPAPPATAPVTTAVVDAERDTWHEVPHVADEPVPEPEPDHPVVASEWEDVSVFAAQAAAAEAADADPQREEHLYALERWLAAILEERERRRSGR